MSLLALQSAFRGEIASDDDGIAPSSPGMSIYRNAYRGRLLAALESSFERTRRWTGEDVFEVAACHYILAHPPASWTLDRYGADFSQLLATLFAGDAEVAELAWLEWHMSQAFTARDRPVLDAAAFAASDQTDIVWDDVSFTMAAGFAMRPIATNCIALWEALAERQDEMPSSASVEPAWLLVWRCGFRPQYRMATACEAEALGNLARGRSLGELVSVGDPDLLGTWLAQWFGEGIFATAA